MLKASGVSAAPLPGMASVLAVIGNDLPILERFVTDMGTALQERYAYYELVIVDNGSTDGSAGFILDHLHAWPNIHFIRLSAPASSEVAITAALEHCIGDHAVLMDPYLDAPEEVMRLLTIAHKGYDVVIAERVNTRGPGTIQRWAYRLAGRIVGEKLQPDASYFRVLSRSVIAALTRIRSPRRSLKYFNALVGYRQIHVSTVVDEGLAGAQKRPAASLWRAIDLVISNSFAPLRFVSATGFIASLGSASYLGYAFLVALLKKHVAEGWFTTSVLMSSMFFILFLILSILSEYVIRILEECQSRPLYFVELERASDTNISNQRNVMNVV